MNMCVHPVAVTPFSIISYHRFALNSSDHMMHALLAGNCRDRKSGDSEDTASFGFTISCAKELLVWREVRLGLIGISSNPTLKSAEIPELW